MTFSTALHQFAQDDLLKAVILLIILDLALGVAAAVKQGTFQLAYVGQFAKDDVLAKVFPWFILYAAAKLGPSVSLLGVDLDNIQKGVFVVVTAALVGSLLSSLADLGFSGFPRALVGGDDSHVKPGP